MGTDNYRLLDIGGARWTTDKKRRARQFAALSPY
jgi:hypothetical protein